MRGLPPAASRFRAGFIPRPYRLVWTSEPPFVNLVKRSKSPGFGHADRDRRRRAGRALPVTAAEAQRPRPFASGGGTERAGFHLRLRRGVLRGCAGIPQGGRPGDLQRHHAGTRTLERDRDPSPRRTRHARRDRLHRDRTAASAAIAAEAGARRRHRGQLSTIR